MDKVVILQDAYELWEDVRRRELYEIVQNKELLKELETLLALCRKLGE